MKILLSLTLVAAAVSSCRTSSGPSELRDLSQAGSMDVTLVGFVPDRYMARGGGASASPVSTNQRGNQPAGSYTLAAVGIKGGVIRFVQAINESDIPGISSGGRAVILKHAQTYDVIYPGMINLHNHTKQNMLPLWGEAKGQFANRFEWRDWNNYTKAVSQNINPWINDGMATCAAFRWSELQAMVLGTTHLQGPSSCISNFAIHQVEDEFAYPAASDKRLLGVQAPTDLVVPEDMPFVWKHIKPLVEQGMTYEAALLQKIKDFCPRMMTQFSIQNVNGQAELAVFKDKANVEGLCDQTPDKFVRFLYWQHKTIAGKKNYLNDPKSAGVIFHLAEGRRHDPYNRIEFEMLKIFGLDQANVNIVHGVGLSADDFRHMADKGMGLIWSPFSNFLLYGETIDLKAAIEAGVPIALGSDWTPTGSRGVLEELKIARAYVRKAGLERQVSDEVLFDMVTEYPAHMLKHLESHAGDGRHGLGRVVPDAAASLVILSRRHDDPYTNFVTADAKDVNLVLVDGRAVYGEEAYITQALPQASYEHLPAAFPDLVTTLSGQTTFTYIPNAVDKDQRRQQLAQLANRPEITQMKVEKACNFSKVFVHQNSGDQNIAAFAQASQLNLDRAIDIQKFLSLNLLTMAFNSSVASGRGDPAFAVADYPRMFSCDDRPYLARIKNFISDNEFETNDEVSLNAVQRQARRAGISVSTIAKKLADLYELPYDTAKDY